MLLKGLIDEDFVNYKKTSMFIAFPSCTFKCEKECGKKVCQNSELAQLKDIKISIKKIVDRYIGNKMTHAIVIGGLEPLDSWEDLYNLILELRFHTLDDIVIYTGYKEEEIKEYVQCLRQFPNIIIKFGRFIPDVKSRYDKVLGVELQSDNQYAKRIS